MLPPATATDLAIQALAGGRVEDHGDHLVLRTPDNPSFHWGNAIHVTSGDPDDAPRWLAAFAAAFPDAGHRAIGLPREPAPGSWDGTGLALGSVESLERRAAPAPTRLAPGYTVRPVHDDAGWTAVRDADLTENAATGERSAAEYAAYADGQWRTRARLVAADHAAWFAAVAADGTVAASLGIVHLPDLDPPTARYQAVLTAGPHRRRGLARHLLGVAASWATARGAERLVIVADTGAAADRLYRAAGFEPGPPAWDAYAAPFVHSGGTGEA